MTKDLFQGYEVKEMDGELTVILDLNLGKEEFSAELGLIQPQNREQLEKEAEKYIRSIFPKLKIAKVLIMVDNFLLASFPLKNKRSYSN